MEGRRSERKEGDMEGCRDGEWSEGWRRGMEGQRNEKEGDMEAWRDGGGRYGGREGQRSERKEGGMEDGGKGELPE